MRNTLVIFIMMLCACQAHAQDLQLNGKITASEEVDGIHIINKTASKFSISDSYGAFTIPAKLNDTLLFSGISYQAKEIIITKFMVASKHINVELELLVNVLDEVVVGKVLTGNLMLDIQNAELKPELNFYQLGIPGYTGKLKTQNERRLYEATSGGGLIPLFPIINALSGRTKRMKSLVKMERLDSCLDQIKAEFSKRLFIFNPLDDSKQTEFFYYCQDDPNFEHYCNLKDPMRTLMFLEAKLKAYKEIIQN